MLTTTPTTSCVFTVFITCCVKYWMICGVLNIARRSSVRQLFLSCCGLRRDMADDKDDFDDEESDRLTAEFVNRVRAERAAAAAADALTGGGRSFIRNCSSSNLQLQRPPPVSLIFHAAGTLHSRALISLSTLLFAVPSCSSVCLWTVLSHMLLVTFSRMVDLGSDVKKAKTTALKAS